MTPSVYVFEHPWLAASGVSNGMRQNFHTSQTHVPWPFLDFRYVALQVSRKQSSYQSLKYSLSTSSVNMWLPCLSSLINRMLLSPPGYSRPDYFPSATGNCEFWTVQVISKVRQITYPRDIWLGHAGTEALPFRVTVVQQLILILNFQQTVALSPLLDDNLATLSKVRKGLAGRRWGWPARKVEWHR